MLNKKNILTGQRGDATPSNIHFVSALPKTRAAYLGEDPADLAALENPQSVEEIRKTAA